MRLCTQNKVHAHWQYTRQINTAAVSTTTVPRRPKHNVGSGGESVVYQDPRAEFLFLLGINLSINPLLMGQLWVSASHLQDANQAHKLRDQPLGQRCSSALSGFLNRETPVSILALD